MRTPNTTHTSSKKGAPVHASASSPLSRLANSPSPRIRTGSGPLVVYGTTKAKAATALSRLKYTERWKKLHAKVLDDRRGVKVVQFPLWDNFRLWEPGK